MQYKGNFFIYEGKVLIEDGIISCMNVGSHPSMRESRTNREEKCLQSFVVTHIKAMII